MRGEIVTVWRPVTVGVKPGGAPLVEWSSQVVEDVLVSPGPRTDLVESNRPDGVEVAWTLHFPKTFNQSLRGCELSVRGGPRCPVIGDPQPYTLENTPTRWWLPVEVERTDG